MPFCTSGRSLPKGDDGILRCEVGFGLDTGTMLGTVGEKITYNVLLAPPANAGTEKSGVGQVARVVADTADGFTYAKRLVYDWRFVETAPGETEVKLDIFFQAKSVFSLP